MRLFALVALACAWMLRMRLNALDALFALGRAVCAWWRLVALVARACASFALGRAKKRLGTRMW